MADDISSYRIYFIYYIKRSEANLSLGFAEPVSLQELIDGALFSYGLFRCPCNIKSSKI